MPLTPISGIATPSAAGLFLSLPNSKPEDHCHAPCNENADSLVPNATSLDGVVLKRRAAHAKHIRKLLRSGDCGDMRCGYGKVEMWRRVDIASFARVGGSMVGMRLLRGAGVDMS